jgi:hypothetical protein
MARTIPLIILLR